MKPKNKEIKTDRLILKSITIDDLDNLKDMLLNDEIKKTFMIPDFNNEDELNHMCNRFMEISNDLNRYLFGVYLNNVLIGFVNDCEIEGEEIEIGYVIDPKYKGNGYATEVLKASIVELFRIGYKKVITGAFVENKASQRVMEKAGMAKTDKIEEEYRGIIHTTILYEIAFN